jgi:gamma-glutamylcyclotransferase (GGCT)/AIG2-like uncharacterized protein YtfP
MGVSRGSAPRYLLVYGTLRRGFDNPHSRYLAENARWRGEARVPGRLYDLGRYPGLRRARRAGDWVTGDLYRLPESPALLAALDEYEGSDFRRRPVIAHSGGRGTVKAWVYMYQPGVSEARRIPSGIYPGARH